MVFENIKQSLEKVSKFMKLSEKEIDLLLKHENINHAMLDVNGKKYEAWRIIHNNALGPGKGGIRFHSDVDEDEVKSLSFWMSLKTSLMGLPLGGAKGGVRVNPKDLSDNEIEEISRAYVRAFVNVIGQDRDIPAPDVYTNSQIMAWMLDEYEKITGKKEPAMITGKPVELGGLSLRTDSTSKGGFIVLKEFLKKINKSTDNVKQEELSQASEDGNMINHITDKSSENKPSPASTTDNKKEDKIKIAIQGFGNAGMNIAKMLDVDRFKIIGVSDSRGGLVDDNGLDIKEVINIKKEEGSVVEYGGSSKISNSELLELNVDILILAALENQITKDNANKIKAKYILELANGPVSSEADEVLKNKKVIVIPDILANAGGVVVSYFEWMLNKKGKKENSDVLNKKFEEIMVNSFEKVWKFYEDNKAKLSMREAAYVIAIKRILETERERGNL